MNRYANAANELRNIKEELDLFLLRWRAQVYKDMKQVAPGVWIHKDYANLSECLDDLRKMIP
jgi:hypothetical protein